MPKPKPWVFHQFGSGDPLASLPSSFQVDYLRCYLHDLNARWVLEEPYYFDRDYLAEFCAFYAQSARSYENLCRRLLVFDSSVSDLEGELERGLGADPNAAEKLQRAFLGFVVLRPIPGAPLGRTVVRWYPEKPGAELRMTTCRDYRVHIAGLRLSVTGLAWQQQDAGVSACATIALWTMLHSRAFLENNGVPTTPEITIAAHRRAPFGDRVFPSDGLRLEQLLESLKEHGYGAVCMAGNVKFPGFSRELFDVERFCGSVAAALRSGYPVLLTGYRGNGGHAMCAVGFRTNAPTEVTTGDVVLMDRSFDALFVHDDNLGPSVRFEVRCVAHRSHTVELVPAAPPPRNYPRPAPDRTSGMTPFIPTGLVIAVHKDVRATPDEVHAEGFNVASYFSQEFRKASSQLPPPLRDQLGVELAVRFFKLSEYLTILPELIPIAAITARVRRELCEKVPPMSLHIAVVRVRLRGMNLVDVLFDTTDSRLNLYAFAHVAFVRAASNVIAEYAPPGHYGVPVYAFDTTSP